MELSNLRDTLRSLLSAVTSVAASDEIVDTQCGSLTKICNALRASGGGSEAAVTTICGDAAGLSAIVSLLRDSLALPHGGAPARELAAELLDLLAREESVAALYTAGAVPALLAVMKNAVASDSINTPLMQRAVHTISLLSHLLPTEEDATGQV
jgi:hypothetical protein